MYSCGWFDKGNFCAEGDFVNARGFKSLFRPHFGHMKFSEDELLQFFGSAVHIEFIKEEDKSLLVTKIGHTAVGA